MKDEIIIGKRESSNFLMKTETLLNLEKGLYKIFEKSFGFGSGEWKKIPKLDYILLFRPLYVKCEGCSVDNFEKDSVYQLSLVYNKNQKIIVHETDKKDEVFNLAEKLSSFFKIKVRDSASDRRNPKWILAS
ncbi:MAG: hypothetical protein Q7W45_02680 [Bacteroidota bacterium]|nr:hypothetical protein [Bacteroidota bacterium]MDP3145841.1 hypothetical protein [Bacteroidota bacterium]MDP3558475.1 hypothetical protein [Bacteroidota bacterium]